MLEGVREANKRFRQEVKKKASPTKPVVEQEETVLSNKNLNNISIFSLIFGILLLGVFAVFNLLHDKV